MMLSAFYYLSIHVLFLLLIHAHIVFKTACQRNRRFKYQSHKLYMASLMVGWYKQKNIYIIIWILYYVQNTTCHVKWFEYGEILIYDNHVRDIHRDLISLLEL